MKAWIAPIIAVVFATAVGGPVLNAHDDSLHAIDPIIGKWKVLKWTVDSRECDAQIGFMMEFTADGKLATFDREDRALRSSQFRINGDGQVRELRVESVFGGQAEGKVRPLVGIFKIERNALQRPRLVICINPFAEKAPSSFESNECDGGNLITLEYITKEDR